MSNLKRTVLLLGFLLGMIEVAQAATPVNDEPANTVALLLNKTCVNLSATTLDATPSVAPAADGAQQTGGARTDVFYPFVATCPTVTMTVSNLQNSTATASVGVITGYSLKADTYIQLGQQTYSLTLRTLTAGQTYYVRV